MKKMTKIILELDEDDLRQVEAVAEVEDRTRSAQLRIIIADWLKRELATAINEDEKQGKRRN